LHGTLATNWDENDLRLSPHVAKSGRVGEDLFTLNITAQNQNFTAITALFTKRTKKTSSGAARLAGRQIYIYIYLTPIAL
jgi:hypothetical protein